jgi:hypothetical protein
MAAKNANSVGPTRLPRRPDGSRVFVLSAVRHGDGDGDGDGDGITLQHLPKGLEQRREPLVLLADPAHQVGVDALMIRI